MRANIGDKQTRRVFFCPSYILFLLFIHLPFFGGGGEGSAGDFGVRGGLQVGLYW